MNTCLGCKKPNPRINPCMEIITNPFVSLGFVMRGSRVPIICVLGF